MKSVHTGPHFPPCPAPFNLAAYVFARAELVPDKIALQILRPTGAERWSYARLHAAVRGTATGLLRLGLESGGRVLLRLGNTPEFPIAFLGAIAAGLIPVPTAAQLTQTEITKMAANLRPDLVIAGDGVALPDYPARVLSEAELRSFEALPPAAFVKGDAERLGELVYKGGP
jgi:acyl-CoA synthetase (AMP-forming)/AMP-acid ligase II